MSAPKTILNTAQLPCFPLRMKETALEQTPFEDPVLARMWATVDQIVRIMVDEIPPELLDRNASQTAIDLYALFDPDDRWPVAQLALDLLGTSLADEFGAMKLSAPMEFGVRDPAPPSGRGAGAGGQGVHRTPPIRDGWAVPRDRRLRRRARSLASRSQRISADSTCDPEWTWAFLVYGTDEALDR